MSESEPEGNLPAEDEARIGALEQAVSQIRDSLAQLVNGDTPARRAGRGVVESRLDRESDVATQVQAELARARAAEQADQTAKSHGDRLAELQEQVRTLTEKTPEPPQRPVERIMFGGRS